MINANRLFLVPAISAFLVLIPVIGIFAWLFIVLYWYDKNKLEIHRFFQGQNYEQNELSENSLRDLK
jgi:hypothetical protein